MSVYTNLQPWSKRLGTLGENRHKDSLCQINSYFTSWRSLGMLLWRAISAVPLSPKQCWLCWIKAWMHNVNTAPGGGGGGGEMPEFDELLR